MVRRNDVLHLRAQEFEAIYHWNSSLINFSLCLFFQGWPGTDGPLGPAGEPGAPAYIPHNVSDLKNQYRMTTMHTQT